MDTDEHGCTALKPAWLPSNPGHYLVKPKPLPKAALPTVHIRVHLCPSVVETDRLRLKPALLCGGQAILESVTACRNFRLCPLPPWPYLRTE